MSFLKVVLGIAAVLCWVALFATGHYWLGMACIWLPIAIGAFRRYGVAMFKWNGTPSYPKRD